MLTRRVINIYRSKYSERLRASRQNLPPRKTQKLTQSPRPTHPRGRLCRRLCRGHFLRPLSRILECVGAYVGACVGACVGLRCCRRFWTMIGFGSARSLRERPNPARLLYPGAPTDKGERFFAGPLVPWRVRSFIS